MRELSLNVLDIAQNSISADASLVEIDFFESTTRHELTLRIKDNGKGMTQEQLHAVRDPFFTTRTTRRVGLGVPLFKMAAEMTGGTFEIISEKGRGTTVCAVFNTDHIDFTPPGDMTGTVVLLSTMNTQIDFLYHYRRDETEFLFDTKQIKEILGDVSLAEPGIAQWLTDYINENTAIQ